MASVHRRPRSQFWHAAFRDASGRLVLRSTKHTNRGLALAEALELERAAKLAGRGELVESQARNILRDIMERASSGEDTLGSESVEGFLKAWLLSKEARKSASTGVRYRAAVENFLKGLGSRAKKPLGALAPRDVDAFLNRRLAEDGVAPRTAILDVKVIRTALNAARRQGLVTTNAAEGVELPDVEGVERGTFTAEEVKLLVEAASGEWRTLILCAYFIGGRLGDMTSLRWADLDLAEGVLTYVAKKNGAKLTVPLHPTLLEHLEELAGTDKAETFVMPGMAGLRPGGRHGLSEGFKRIVRKAGLNLQEVAGKGVRKQNRRTFHALRHSFTSALANAGVAPELRMKLTGHSSAAVHKGYTHHELKVLKDAVGKLPSL